MANNIILPPQGTNGTTNPIAETLDTTGSSGPQRQFISLRSGTAGDNADVIGPTNDTAATSDTATASINARLQRVAQNLTTVKNTLGAPFQAGASVGNTSFGISGTLPAFASTPTVNVGTEPGTGSTGAAVPSTAQYAGMSVAGNLTGLTGTANGLKVDGSSVTQPVSIASMPSTPVTGTFFQSTQPVSATSLPLPAGAATSASQPAINGDGGALAHVTNFPATQPVSIASMPSTPVTGTFWQATQPVSAASLPLPTGAAASANQPTNAAIGSTTSGQTGLLEMGAVTTASPSYTTGQTAPISLDTSGNLRVNVVAGGGAGGTSSTFGSAFPGTGTAAGGEYLSSPPTLTSGQMVALQTDVNGNLKVNVSAGGAAGGTSSNFSATFPAVGTAAGMSATTSAPSYTTGQMVALSGDLAGNLRVNGSGVTQPVSGTFWQSTQPVSIASMPSTPVTGTFWQSTQPVSAASLPLPSGAATSANQPTAAAAASTTSGQTGGLEMGAVTTAAPTYTTGTSNFLSLNTSGGLRVDGSGITQPVSGTFWQATQPVSAASLPLPTGASTSALQPTNASLGSTTSGQTGNLELGAVTTSAPSYTTGQTNALSLNTSGGLRVDGSAVTQPVSGTFWQATQAVSIASMPSTPVTGTFWQSTQPVSVASSVTVAGGNKPVGPAGISPAQATIGTTAAVIVAARTGAVGTGRCSVTLKNTGTATVFIGGSGVTTSTGYPLGVGEIDSFDTTAVIYGISTVAGNVIGVMETF